MEKCLVYFSQVLEMMLSSAATDISDRSKRMFRLPSYQELTKEQINIHNLPSEGKYLVIGRQEPGKTVIAIYRAQMLRRANLDATLIVYKPDPETVFE